MTNAGIWLLVLISLTVTAMVLYMRPRNTVICKECGDYGQCDACCVEDESEDLVFTGTYSEIAALGDLDAAHGLPVGWQGWEGSVLAPIQSGTRIVIMLRNGSIIPSCGGWCNWVHHECGGDIVAWRIADQC